jgi:hypothetical protein
MAGENLCKYTCLNLRYKLATHAQLSKLDPRFSLSFYLSFDLTFLFTIPIQDVSPKSPEWAPAHIIQSLGCQLDIIAVATTSQHFRFLSIKQLNKFVPGSCRNWKWAYACRSSLLCFALEIGRIKYTEAWLEATRMSRDDGLAKCIRVSVKDLCFPVSLYTWYLSSFNADTVSVVHVHLVLRSASVAHDLMWLTLIRPSQI